MTLSRDGYTRHTHFGEQLLERNIELFGPGNSETRVLRKVSRSADLTGNRRLQEIAYNVVDPEEQGVGTSSASLEYTRWPAGTDSL